MASDVARALRANAAPWVIAILGLALTHCSHVNEIGAVDEQPGDDTGWHLVWNDEFDGPAGRLDSSRWQVEVGTQGLEQEQLQYNTDRVENVALNGQGALELVAREEPYMGFEYTGARITTQDKFAKAYGRFEARLQLPEGSGLWVQFWLLGDDYAEVGWPEAGDIGIVEYRGNEPEQMHARAHGPGLTPPSPLQFGYALPNATTFAASHHVFALEWEPAALRWFVDDQQFGAATPRDLPAEARWVFDHPFFLVLYLAVGGTFPGRPDAVTTFPQILTVDYVRVYDKL
jgi:beta-glucanase (GH16 family)